MTEQSGAHRRFVLVTFAVTWVLWLPVTLASWGLPSFSNPYVGSWFSDFVALRANTPAHWLVLAGGVLGPATGAVAAWHRRAGRMGLRALGTHLVDIRIAGWRGWLTALLPVVYFALASAVVFALTGVTFTSELGPLPFLGFLAAGCALIIGEESGWRGTQLPLLQERHSALRSSVMVAVTWACWHFPILLMWQARPGGSLMGAAFSLVPYLVMTIPATIMHTFAFNSARGLVLVSVVFHGLHNHLNANLTPAPASEAALEHVGALADPVLLGVFWFLAAVLWLAFRGENLAARPKVTAEGMLGRVAGGEAGRFPD